MDKTIKDYVQISINSSNCGTVTVMAEITNIPQIIYRGAAYPEGQDPQQFAAVFGMARNIAAQVFRGEPIALEWVNLEPQVNKTRAKYLIPKWEARRNAIVNIQRSHNGKLTYDQIRIQLAELYDIVVSIQTVGKDCRELNRRAGKSEDFPAKKKKLEFDPDHPLVLKTSPEELGDARQAVKEQWRQKDIAHARRENLQKARQSRHKNS